MIRKIVSASVATALVLGSVSPAFAQSYAMMPELQAPLGATATVNLRVPLGAAPAKARKASYGLTVGYGRELDSLTADGRIATRHVEFADIRFTDSFKLQKAEVATFDLANLDQDKRLNMMEGKDSTTWIIIGLVVAGAVVWAVSRDDDDDDDDDVDEVL